MSDALVRGFNHPVQQSQHVFRQIMKAMSEPGTMVDLPELDKIQPLNTAAYALALTLFDQATSVWLSPTLDQPSVRQNLHFHTGAPFVRDPSASDTSNVDFVLATCHEQIALNALPKGSAEYPETSATVVFLVDSFNSSSGISLTLSGPGIESQRSIVIGGLNPDIESYLLDRPDEFPKGLDFIFCCNHQLVCIPRSTQVISSITNEELA